MLKMTPREERMQEGIDLSNNSLKDRLHSTFGQFALGPLTDDFFSDHEKENINRSTGLQYGDNHYIAVDEIVDE